MAENNRKAKDIMESEMNFLKKGSFCLPDNFESELHLKLVKAAQNQQAKKSGNYFFGFIFKPAFIIPLLVIVFSSGIFLGINTSGKHQEQPNIIGKSGMKEEPAPLISQSVSVATGEPVSIKLVYNSKIKIEKVKFTIMLENGLKFVSDDSEVASMQILSWEGSFESGKNVIPFVVAPQFSGEMLVNAIAEYNGIKKRQIIKVVSTKETGTIFKLVGENNV